MDTKEEILQCAGAFRMRPNLTFSGACMSVILSTSLQRNGLRFASDQDDNGSWGYLICQLPQGQAGFGEILRSRKGGVHNSEPIFGRALLDLELQCFPIGIDHHVDIVITL